MKIRVVVGDATEVTGVPALVVPANRQLTLGWGSHLAEKVRRLAGPGVECEALAAHPKGVAPGEAVLTTAGALPGFTHLVHAAVLDKHDLGFLFLLRLKERTSRETLAKAVRSSLRAAADAGLAGLVFTPMGAGIGGMKDAVCARVMLGEARTYTAAVPESPLRDVVIACRHERTARAFREALAAGYAAGPAEETP